MGKMNINVIISLIIGFGVGIVTVCFFIGFEDKTLNVLKATSIIFVGISLLLALFQFRNTNQWNKRQLATIRIHESDKNLKNAITILHPTLAVVDRSPDEPYEIYEIHNKMGVFLKNSKFVFHGEQTDDDIKNLPEDNKQKENHINQFDKNINGREVRDTIIALLNEYEYVSLNVNCGIFDKETVKRLFDIKLLRTFLKFEKYIKHLRGDHKYGDTVYIELEGFAKEIKKNHKPN